MVDGITNEPINPKTILKDADVAVAFKMTGCVTRLISV